MEDVNWLLKKWGFSILMLLIAVRSVGASGGNQRQ